MLFVLNNNFKLCTSWLKHEDHDKCLSKCHISQMQPAVCYIATGVHRMNCFWNASRLHAVLGSSALAFDL